MLSLNSITHVILQHAAGYYRVPLDGTLGIAIVPGTGNGVLTINGKSYAIPLADAMAGTGSDAGRAELAALLTSPVTVISPGDDLSAALIKAGAGLVELLPGHYSGSYNFNVSAAS